MNKELSQKILDSVDLGLVYANKNGQVNYCNPAAERMLNLSREKLLSLTLEKLLGKSIAAFQSPFTKIIKTEGSVIEQHCSPMQNTRGEWTGVIIVLTDVTEHVRTQGDLARSRDELKVLHEAAQLMNSSLELKQILDKLLEIMRRVVNYSCCRIYLYQEVERNLRLEAQYEEEQDCFQQPEPETVLKKVFTTGITIYREGKGLSLTIPLKRGQEVLGVIYMQLQQQEEAPEQVQRLLVNLASLACLAIKNGQMFQHIHELATVDGLTKLYNRQYFDVIYNREITRSKRFRTPLSLVMVDVNGLKEINDSLGHSAGDSILVQAARLLQLTVRSIDYVFRYGGDEMVILLLEADEHTAGRVVQRIREKEADWNAQRGNEAPILSLSIGFAFTNGDLNEEELLMKADHLMYQDKERYYRENLPRHPQTNTPEHSPEK